MNAIDRLMAEHRVIEHMLTALEDLVGRLDQGDHRAVALLMDFVELLEAYVDRLHHTKEERRLFEIVIERGLGTDGGSVAALIHHHDSGRSHLQDLRSELGRLTQGDPHAAAACALAARQYAELLRAHIRLEDEEVFPLVAKAMSGEEDQSLEQYFVEFDEAQHVADLRARVELLLVRCRDLDAPRQRDDPSEQRRQV